MQTNFVFVTPKKKKKKKEAGAKSTEGQKGHFAPPTLIGVQGEPRQIACKRKKKLERNHRGVSRKD